MRFSLFLLVFLSYLIPCHAADFSTYLGCYMDRAEVDGRALPYYQSLDKEMTVSKCIKECNNRGMSYAGLQYKQECYCSRKPPRYDKLSEDRCNMDCEGSSIFGDNRKCGGALALSVYHNPDAKPPTDDKRPLLCLVMILKNEGHTIMDTLVTIKPFIDCWYILDTGSTDDTKEKITNYLKDIPGKLFEEPFVDYGATRNRILVLAKETGNPVFTLMLSADERVINGADMRAFLQEFRYAGGSQHGAYPVIMNTGVKFDSLRLARVDSGWRYRARVHEYLAPASGPYLATFRPIPEINVLFNATDGDRRFKSQFFIKRILEEDLAKDPQDTRSMYYLARTNSGVGNHTEAIKYYAMLAERSKWDEEVYHGKLMKAIETKFVSPPVSWQERQNMLLEAYMYKPNSMDALHVLAQEHYDSGRPILAYLYMIRGVQIKPPPGLSTAENVLLRPTRYLYDYEGHRLLGFAARDIGEWEQCVKSFQHVLDFNPKDTIVADRILKCQQEWQFMKSHSNQFATDEASAKKQMAAAANDKAFPPAPFIDAASQPTRHISLIYGDHHTHHHTIYQIEMEDDNTIWWILLGCIICIMSIIGIRHIRRQKKVKV